MSEREHLLREYLCIAEPNNKMNKLCDKPSSRERTIEIVNKFFGEFNSATLFFSSSPFVAKRQPTNFEKGQTHQNPFAAFESQQKNGKCSIEKWNKTIMISA